MKFVSVLVVSFILAFTGVYAGDHVTNMGGKERSKGVMWEDVAGVYSVRYYYLRTEVRPNLVDKVSECSGVDYASKITRYTLSVRRGKAFGWSEIENACLLKALGATSSTELPENDSGWRKKKESGLL